MSTNQKAFVYTHLGLGDMFTMNGAVRFLRERYSKVYLVYKDMYKETVRSMYEDDPGILIVVVTGDEELHPWQVKSQHFLKHRFHLFFPSFLIIYFFPTFS